MGLGNWITKSLCTGHDWSSWQTSSAEDDPYCKKVRTCAKCGGTEHRSEHSLGGVETVHLGNSDTGYYIRDGRKCLYCRYAEEL
ncbi:hypothetical protein ACWCQS_07080 [Streptomyces sp. NPDC002076]